MSRIIRKAPKIGVIVRKYSTGYKGKRKEPYFPNPEAHRQFVKKLFCLGM